MSELHAYTLLVLVGFLPSEIWRITGSSPPAASRTNPSCSCG